MPKKPNAGKGKLRRALNTHLKKQKVSDKARQKIATMDSKIKSVRSGKPGKGKKLALAAAAGVAEEGGVTVVTGTAGKRKRMPELPFAHSDAILLVGEGNFSFARSLIEQVGGNPLVATSLDTLTVLEEKYSDAADNVAAIESLEGTVHYGVDATRLGGYRALRRAGGYDKICFNFPHCGKGMKDRDRNVRANQELLGGFLKSAVGMLRGKGEIMVTLRSGEPYDSWQLRTIAKACGLAIKTTIPFLPEMYPNYTHRRTIGFDDSISTDHNEDILRSRCYTCIFTVGGAEGLVAAKSTKEKKEKKEGKRKSKGKGKADDDDDDSGSD
ncbi:hypothetical protein HK101_003563 [Irineochytrium annulatum]|nr:hypothetical protein HK101_003563 [Irineochytrium annulatum]